MAFETEIDPCEVCDLQNATTIFSGFDGVHQECPRCGEFKLSGTASSIIRQGLGKDKRALLSGWIRNQNRMGSIPMISSTNLDEVLASGPPPIVERANMLLLEAESQLNGLGQRFNIAEPRFLAASYSSSKGEVNFLSRMLSDQGFIEHQTLDGGAAISPAGYTHLDQIMKAPSASTNGFVAMSFHEDLTEVYSSGFEPGVLGAGYNPIRMDRLEHINRIDDEIIRQINGSKFLVADFTGHRSGVYFEAGYAMGLGLPIFWTCRKSDLGELHFDIRQFNCIDWESSEELASRLQSRIEAVLGKGSR